MTYKCTWLCVLFIIQPPSWLRTWWYIIAVLGAIFSDRTTCLLIRYKSYIVFPAKKTTNRSILFRNHVSQLNGVKPCQAQIADLPIDAGLKIGNSPQRSLLSCGENNIYCNYLCFWGVPYLHTNSCDFQLWGEKS